MYYIFMFVSITFEDLVSIVTNLVTKIFKSCLICIGHIYENTIVLYKVNRNT